MSAWLIKRPLFVVNNVPMEFKLAIIIIAYPYVMMIMIMWYDKPLVSLYS